MFPTTKKTSIDAVSKRLQPFFTLDVLFPRVDINPSHLWEGFSRQSCHLHSKDSEYLTFRGAEEGGNISHMHRTAFQKST